MSDKKLIAENARLRVANGYECELHHKWQARAEQAEHKLAEARGLLEWVQKQDPFVQAAEGFNDVSCICCDGEASDGETPYHAGDCVVVQIAAFLAATPAVPPPPLDCLSEQHGPDCPSWCPERAAPPPVLPLWNHGPRREPCLCPGCPATVPTCWVTPMCRLCAGEDCEHEEPPAAHSEPSKP